MHYMSFVWWLILTWKEQSTVLLHASFSRGTEQSNSYYLSRLVGLGNGYRGEFQGGPGDLQGGPKLMVES